MVQVRGKWLDSLFRFYMLVIVFKCCVCGTNRHGNTSVTKRYVAGFYHIYGAKQGAFQNIVNEQITMIKQTGLLNKVDVIFYTTSGEASDFRLKEKKFKHLKDWKKDGREDMTLGLVYKHCKRHRKSKVFYFHDKGSFHTNKENELFRKTLNCFVLNPSCITALDTFDTCGFKISPIPWMHYTGNFWWANCHYINQLIDPLSPSTNQTFSTLMRKYGESKCTASSGRYFAESWVASLPDFKPSDCMPSSMNSHYFFGAEKLPNLFHVCPTPLGKFGAQCGVPESWLKPEDYYQGYREFRRKTCWDEFEPKIIERSRIWYGRSPKLFLEWVAKLKVKPNLTENQVVKGERRKQLYTFQNGCLHPLQSMEIFRKKSVGNRDNMQNLYDNFVVIPDFEIMLLLCDRMEEKNMTATIF
jgi:hypothetical protein